MQGACTTIHRGAEKLGDVEILPMACPHPNRYNAMLPRI